jgi:hypothetical protein
LIGEGLCRMCLEIPSILRIRGYPRGRRAERFCHLQLNRLPADSRFPSSACDLIAPGNEPLLPVDQVVVRGTEAPAPLALDPRGCLAWAIGSTGTCLVKLVFMAQYSCTFNIGWLGRIEMHIFFKETT